MKICFLIFVLNFACSSSEPHCSKFHYEEKLLEKMIRTEILVENMKKQMDDIEARVTGALTKLNEERTTWKGEIETLQEESKGNLVRLQAETKKNFDKKMQILEELKGNILSPNVAFNAKNVKDKRPGNGNTIIFTDVLLNLGEAYNSDTGIFTVPHGGIYLFTVQLCIDNSKDIDYGMVVDGIFVDKSRYQDNYHSVCCFKLATTLSLKSGNKVWVKVIRHISSGQILYHYEANYWTSFAGVLIHTN